MYILIEMTANRNNPEHYGRFVKIHGVYGSLHRQEFEEVYADIRKLLSVEKLKMIHTVGVTGAATVEMARQDIYEDQEVQLFAEFQDSRRFWIFELPPDGG